MIGNFLLNIVSVDYLNLSLGRRRMPKIRREYLFRAIGISNYQLRGSIGSEYLLRATNAMREPVIGSPDNTYPFHLPMGLFGLGLTIV